MKKVFTFIADMFSAVADASYAAHLARNGQYERAKQLIAK